LKLVFSGDISAIVTCPINKTSIRSAGIPFIGHTELLAHFGGVKDYIMMMANRNMRVSLVTIHIPIKDVPGSINTENIFMCISITCRSMMNYFKINKPRIKVCGLNPHAGEHGIMGNEEIMIHEAVSMARALNIDVEGPFPADTLFHKVDCDAYIAMYHDQGLIPVKTTSFEKTVNITLGLPFIRTSPGHGTGYDIAGKGMADPSGLIEAYKVAENMIC
jgi:4-hydroxythreonine-4-phosphate dehydrogenase